MTAKNYLITGAASGIGKATALVLAAPNTHLILHTRKQRESLESVAQSCRDLGASVSLCLADLSLVEDLDSITSAMQELDHLNGIVHCAGYPEWKKLGELEEDSFVASLECVTTAFFRLVQRSLPLLRACEDGARLVACSSFLAHKLQVGQMITPASASAKAALEALVKSMAVQLAPEGMTINCVVPGYIKKDGVDHKAPAPQVLEAIEGRIPAGRLGTPAEVADLIDFLLQGNSRYITGQLLHIDGGLLLK